MDRRTLIGGAGASLLATLPAARAAATSQDGWRRYTVTTKVDLAPTADPAMALWLPVASSIGPYQRARAPKVDTDGHAELVKDARYKSAVLRVRWPGAGPRTVTVTQTVATRDRALDATPLAAGEHSFWLEPVPSLPTYGIVKTTADRIVAGHDTPRARARALYDWVVDNTFRDAATRGCGIGGIDAMLRTGLMGGKCADINSLMVGLSRAAGLPARDAYGLRLGPSSFVKQLGASGDVTHAQHCRAEVWLDGEGWLPVDPADVRKVVLESKLAVNSPEVKAQRERLFGSWEMNWMAYNHATDIILPGAARAMDEHFLMYPCALSAKDELDQLDPASFRYAITSTVLAA